RREGGDIGCRGKNPQVVGPSVDQLEYALVAGVVQHARGKRLVEDVQPEAAAHGVVVDRFGEESPVRLAGGIGSLDKLAPETFERLEIHLLRRQRQTQLLERRLVDVQQQDVELERIGILPAV